MYHRDSLSGAYRNYVRRRFNYDEVSPAELLGFAGRRLRETELLSWRKDWGASSIHPLAKAVESIEEVRATVTRAA